MASSSPSAATCVICSELFDDPRMLQCLHSFCCKCLMIKGSATSVECPTCQKSTPLKSGGVNALLKDLRKSYEAEVAEYARKIQSEEEKSCDQCVDKSNGPAVSFCMECCEFLCESCSKHHKTWRKTLNHELQQVGSTQLGSKALNVPHKPMNCQLHSDEALKFYCETCSALICRDCMDSVNHKDHTVDRVEQVAEKEKLALQSTSGNVDAAKAKLDGAIADGNEAIQRIQGKQKSIEDGIDRAFKALNDALHMRKQALLAKTAEISIGKQTALTIQVEIFKNLHKELFEISGKITDVTGEYTPVEMLSAKGAIANKLEQLLKEYQVINLLPCKSEIMPSMLDTSDLAEIISSFGAVLGGSYPGEAKTDIHIPRAITGKQKRVTITTYDMQGKPFPYGDERVEITLSLLGSNDPPLCTTVIDNKDGTYVASFTPSSKGEHELCVYIDGHHIKGSPFPLYVREARDYAKVVSCQTSFSTSSTKINDVAVDENGDVYVAVCRNNTIQVFKKNGEHIRTIGTGGTGNCQFNNPIAIAIRGSILYVADSTCQVQKLTTSGEFISKFGIQDSDNVLYVTIPGTRRELGRSRKRAGKNSGKHKINACGICLDKDGRVYLSESGNDRISVFEADGTFLYHISGTTDESKLSGPWGLAYDHCGNLHVVNTNTNTVKVFTTQGQYITQYSSGLIQPSGIGIDDEGNSFITQYLFYYQQGHGTYYYSQLCILDVKHEVISTSRCDNIQYGTGITVDKEGSVYLCSYGNGQVYKY